VKRVDTTNLNTITQGRFYIRMLRKIALDGSLLNYRRISILCSIALTILLIMDTLTTRQILPYNNTSGSFLFFLNILVAYGIGSWILFDT
jgi:hypothetical protein